MPAGRPEMIVVAGEALVDLTLGQTDELHAHPGGGPFNAARTIARLGQPVTFLGRISNDRFGARLRAQLQADGVALDAVVATDDPTTLALAELDEHGAASYRFYTDGTSAPGLDAQTALAALPAGLTAAHIGTLGLVLEPMAGALETVVEHLGSDVVVVLDPNCRPLAIDDPPGYRARLARMLRRADVVKVSEEDLAWLDPGRAPTDAARALLSGGASVALMTRGSAGALIVTAREQIDVAAPQVEVVDTIGAGDAFGGAFLAWWVQRGLGRGELSALERVREATAFACLVAALTCERAGASPPHRTELPA